MVRSPHHFSIENGLKALKSALETKHKKLPVRTGSRIRSHLPKWAKEEVGRQQAGRGGGCPQRAKPVKINAHYLAPPFRDPAAPEGLHK